jgi:F-type H+-transporting ATPase subunit b
MRIAFYSGLSLLLNAAAAFAQEGAQKPAGLMDVGLNVMFYVVIIFVIFAYCLKKLAMGPIIAGVEAREKSLEEAIEGAKRDRAAAAKLLADQQAGMEAAKAEAVRFIAGGRATAEKMRHDMVEQTRREQQEVLERARQEIEREKDRAVIELRREAVDLAIAGASRVIEANLDSAGNRRLVEGYLGALGSAKVVQ